MCKNFRISSLEGIFKELENPTLTFTGDKTNVHDVTICPRLHSLLE